MSIGHVAVWAKDIEVMKDFYIKYFNGRAGIRYMNEARHFSSYFIHFDAGAPLEIMHIPTISEREKTEGLQFTGLAHIAFSVGSEESVRNLTNRLHKDGYMVVDGPRKTGDGYFESVVLDPEKTELRLLFNVLHIFLILA